MSSSSDNVLEEFFVEILRLPDDAKNWLLGLWDATQFLDDVADRDEISQHQFDNALHLLLIDMPANGFFAKHTTQLLTALATYVAKWQASDFLERLNRADQRTFMWRAGFYDVVLTVTILCHGLQSASKLAPDILSLYGETYESYKKEFPDG